MSDSDRLQQLRRQRAAIAAHLNWLDDEIKQEARLDPTATEDQSAPKLQLRTPPAEPAARSAPAPAPQPREADNPSPALTTDPDAVLEEWTEQSGGPSDQPVSKTGCWIIFAALAIIGVGGSVTLIYLIYG